MYCQSCGTKINEGENYCYNCGKPVNEVKVINEPSTTNKNEGTRTASIVLGILSLVGTFIAIFAPIALILSIIGLVLAIKANKVYKNPAGIILNAIGLFFSFIITSIIALIIIFSYNIIKNDLGNLGNFNISNYIQEYQEEYGDKF